MNVIRGPSHGASEAERRQSALARDAALSRISRTRRLLIVGAAGLTALFAAIASALVPGRAASAHGQPSANAAGAAQASGGASSRRMPPLASPAALGLQAPASAPQAAPSGNPSAAAQQQAAADAAAQQQAAPAPAPSAPAAVSGGS